MWISDEAVSSKMRDKLRLVLVTMRPGQWPKNAFLLAALLFSRNIFHPAQVLTSVFAFGVFCLASGAVYVLNDLLDMEQDRNHPKKQSRPLASGALDPETGALAFSILLPVSLLAGYLVNGTFLLAVSAYLVLQIAYCTFIKKIILLDVFAIASGFFLRVAAGSAAIQVPMSKWLLICTIFISLFLALAKRRHELLALGEGAGEHRKVLEEYNLLFLDQMVSIATAGTIVSYSLYTLSEETIAKFGTSRLWLTVPIVLYGISRYLYRVYRHGDGGQPEELVWKDRPLLACVAVYVVSVVLILYSHSGTLS
jgi:4-hydroxybenzoate polyprenyltransferase